MTKPRALALLLLVLPLTAFGSVEAIAPQDRSPG